ncbi:Beta-barrel assembly-enhancing protease [Sinobacterium norvegicum]|uniref:Beta-barrel assembly-enhancing protease n=1 Tax=Sinobacterium norvegicum TaxID=1641715 RepID=A0ABM9AFB8_9GAMM|nr:tetratricopeptide repeat protein [Sinobacterium norvegicum]CAH0991424.1 Beta-barrel assembly-enhancing protease [Sinobacterium norvegicum]
MTILLRRLIIAASIVTLAACGSLQPTEKVAAVPPPAKVEAPTKPFEVDTLYALLVAEVAGARQRYDIALGNYLQQAHKTQDPQIAARTARLAQYLQANEAAIDAATLWTQLEPESSEAHYMLAINLGQSGAVNEAFEHMQQVDRLGGVTNFTVIAAQGLKLPASKREYLLSQFDTALQKRARDEQLLMGKAILQQQTDPEAALVTVEKVLDQSPDNLRALSIQTTVLQQLGRGDEAFAILHKALEENPHNQRLRLQYARQLTAVDLVAAQQQFEILSQQAPNDSDILYSLALIDFELKQYDSSRNHFLRLRDLGPRSNDANFYLGAIAEQVGDPASAIDYYQLVTPSQNYLPSIQALARLWYGADMAPTFDDYIEQQRQLEPEQSVPLYLLQTDILQRQQLYDHAVGLLDQGLKRHPGDSNLLYSRSLINEKRGKLSEMEADLRKILADDPNNPAALNALGYVLSNYTNRLQEAYELIAKALQIQPNDPATLDSMGWVLFKQGKYEQSLSYLNRAYDGYPDAEVAAHLGEVLWQLERREEAMKVWQQALQKQPDDVTLNETLQRLAPELL